MSKNENMMGKQKKDSRRGHNEGTIRKRSDGTWEARYVEGYSSEGKTIRKSIYGKKREIVSKKLTNILNDINNGTYISPSTKTLGEWADTWLEKYKVNNLVETTYNSYQQQIRVHIRPKLGHIQLKNLNTTMIQEFCIERLKNGRQPIVKNKKTRKEVIEPKDKSLSAATVIKIYNILYEMLEKAVEVDLIKVNPCKGAEPPRIERRMKKSLSEVEVTLFLNALNGVPEGLIFRIALTAGLRKSELLALKWDDIDFKEGFIFVDEGLVNVKNKEGNDKKSKLKTQSTKTEKSIREVAVPDDIIGELKLLKAQQERSEDHEGLH